jgi:hypothetical protein
MTEPDGYGAIVRIMGQGQFKINEDIVKRINEIDDTIVQILQNEANQMIKIIGQRSRR